ncbi:hypothetical protein A3D05_06120 [Candidatus Gottesmanbacteria bacterium RIFCSPHIGHO2_02_FULL_40_24]|nr:MAG: hypothetical protein A3D05_06120 [Candidatus Gottesmanbacteria bacterium RIFCSPHIGHO2_02_FULL_40_24]OGG33785.1 MAG: hypothetical protein A3I80_03185 [Candidatus Gottesmanbacteria bacterium RIFCSPLOWO2_02_FULL_40_10]
MIFLGADHGGYHLKEKLKKWLKEWELVYEDLGNTDFDKDDDYPRYAFAVAESVANEEKKGKEYPYPWNKRPKGILICRSAIGMVIAANKIKGAKAGAAYNERMAKLSREHNDANILALSEDLVDEILIIRILKTWLDTEFSGEDRHKRRIRQIGEYEVKIQNSNDK